MESNNIQFDKCYLNLDRLHPAFGADFSVQPINLIIDERRVDNFSPDDVQMMNDLDDTAQEEAQDLSIHSRHNCRSPDVSQTSMEYSDFKDESDRSQCSPALDTNENIFKVRYQYRTFNLLHFLLLN